MSKNKLCGTLTWFEDLNHNTFVVGGVDTFVDFGILATTNLFDYFIVILGTTKFLAI